MTDEQQANAGRRYRTAYALLALALAVFSIVLFRGAAENEFIWDDPIVFGRQLPYFDNLQNVFFPPRGKIPQFGVHYYRPATIMTYQLDEKLVTTFWAPEEQQEGRRLVYHASVVVYHGIASALVFLFGVVLARSCGVGRVRATVVALAGGVLFAVHPIHVECVAWMAGRTDILCAIFLLLAGIFYLRLRRDGRPWDIAGFGVAALLAMLTKETGLGVIPFAFALELLVPRGAAEAAETSGPPMTRAERRRNERKRKGKGKRKGAPAPPRWRPVLTKPIAVAWVLAFVAAVAYFLLRREAIGNFGTRAAWAGPDEIVSHLFGAIGWYAVKAIWPPPQSAFIGEHPGGAYTIVGVAAMAAAAVVFYLGLSKRRLAFESSLVALALAGIALPLFTALRSISESPVAERYLYIPTVGICLLVASLFEGLARRFSSGRPNVAHAGLAAATLLVAVPAAVAALDRADVWRNNFVFWQDAVDKAPDQGLPHLHLGITYAEKGQIERALELYEEAYTKYDDAEGRSKALNNKASALMRQNRFREAIVELRRATQEVPRYATAHYNWGVAEKALAQQTQDPQEQDAHLRAALSHLQQSIQFNPRYAKAHLQMGELLILIGQRDRAVGYLNDAIRHEPNGFSGKRARELLRRLAEAS